jgi:hypothetical protein
MGNDELMKKVFTQARKFMKYDSENFITVWTNIVLLTIQSKMNVLRIGYAVSIKNQIIQGMCYMQYIACTAMMLTCQLLLVCTVFVTNPNENMGDSSFPGFGLSEQLIDNMIAQKCKGAILLCNQQLY